MSNIYLVKASEISRFGFEKKFVTFYDELVSSESTKDYADKAIVLFRYDEYKDLPLGLYEIFTKTALPLVTDKELGHGIFLNNENVSKIEDLPFVESIKEANSFYTSQNEKEYLNVYNKFKLFCETGKFYKESSFQKKM